MALSTRLFYIPDYNAQHKLLRHDDKVGCGWAQHELLQDNEVLCELLRDDEVKCKLPQLGYLQVEVAC